MFRGSILIHLQLKLNAMKTLKPFLFAAIALICFSSCSKRLSYFTDDLSNEFRWSETELQKIQFYLSEDIVLRRALGSDHSTISNGKIKLVDGKQVEEIVFKKGTPGVCLFSPKTDRVAVSFDEEGADNYLMFGPNKRANGRYVLLAKEWQKYKGKVSYNDKIYETTSHSAYAALMVDLDTARKVSYSKKTAGGRKVNP